MKRKTILLSLLAITVPVAGAFTTMSLSGAAAGANNIAPGHEIARPAIQQRATALQGVFQLSHSSASLREDFIYGKLLDGDDPTKLLIRRRTAFDNTTATWTSTDKETLGAPFTIRDVCFQGEGHYYVYGVTAQGEDVIQRWKKKIVGMPGSTTHVYKRFEIYRGTGLQGVQHIGVDPNGRFLLVLHAGSSLLSSIPLPGGGNFSTLYDTASLPELTDVTSMLRLQHAVDGRVWVLTRSLGTLDRIVLHDLENDGVFEMTENIDNDLYHLRYGMDGGLANVTNNFIGHW